MEIKNLNIIPDGDKPIIHASQYDENRSVRFDLKDGTDDFTLVSDLVITCNIKKVDGNIVTFEVDNTEDTYIVITLPLQATACAGPNIGEIVITDEDNFIIGTINFILEVEKSPMLGGIESASDIHDLEEQIEVIVTQVIATDYYTKSEVDNLLNDKADISDLPDMSDYYDKSEVDNLLDDKADLTDLPDMNNYYNKTQVDNKLDQKANISDLPDMSDYYTKTATDNLLANKADISDLPDMSNYYTKTQIDNKFLDIMPVNTGSGSVANFDTLIVAPLVALKTAITAQGGGGTPSSPVPIVGFSEVNVYRRGANLWNEVWQLGSISESNGQNVTNTTNIRSTNYIPVAPSTAYYFKGYVKVFEYKKDKTYIGHTGWKNKTAITLSSETYFIRFIVDSGYGTTYNNDISINYPSTDTTYHAYNPQSDTFTLNLGQTVYGGYVDWKNGKLVVTCVKEHIDLTGKNYSTSGGFDGWTISLANSSTGGSSSANKICSICGTYAYSGVSSVEHFYIQASGTLVIYLTENTFRTGNFDIVYPLATPIEIDLSTTMPSTIEGVQNWFADSGDIDISFKQGIQNYVDSKLSALSANRSLSLTRAAVEENSDEGSER